MEHIINRLLQDYERGKVTRRQLIQQARLELVDEPRQQVDGDHARLRNIGEEDVAFEEMQFARPTQTVGATHNG